MKSKKKINAEFFRNKTFIGASCIALALLIAFGIAPLVNSIYNGTVMVVCAKEDIQQGTQITAAMLETVKVGKTGLPHGIETKINGVAGKYAAVDILKDDMVSARKLSEQNSVYDLKNGQMLMSVTIKNLADGLSGKLKAGDIVSVFAQASTQNLGNNVQPAPVPKELQYVEVAAVTSSTGADTDTAQAQKQQSDNGSTDNLPSTVTLIVNQQQASVLAGYDNGALHIALVCRGNEKKSQDLLTEQGNVLTQETNSAGVSQ
jgi:pilus assembly protein CpaB